MAIIKVPEDYRAVSAAMAATIDGDSIRVRAGYNGNETILVNSDDIDVSFAVGVPNVVFQLGLSVTRFTAYGTDLKILGSTGSNSVSTGEEDDSIECYTGSDFVFSDDGDDFVSLNIDGDDDINVSSGINTVQLYGNTGSGGSLTGSGNGYTTVKSGNLGQFTFDFVNKLDTKDVVASAAQIASFERIEDSTAASSAITIRLQGEGGSVNVAARLAGTDSVRFLDNGLTSRVIETATAFSDLLSGSAFNDSLFGGNGSDTYVVNDAGDVITEAANQGNDLVQSSISHTLAANVERLTLIGAAAINGTGNGLANTLAGNNAANVLDGAASADTMSGAGGNDVYVVDNSADKVVETANQGTDLVRSSVTFTLANNVENLALTGISAVNAIGNSLANTLTGNAAVNALTGKGGDDTYIVQNTGDIVVETDGEGDDLVRSEASFTLGDHVESLVLLGGSAIDATGNALANDLTGNGGANALNGRGGADFMAGLAGGDTYFVDDRNDKTIELANEGTDTVRSAVSWTLAANVENLTLLDTASTATGNSLANVLKGNSAKNSLDGGAGKDELQGGAGADSFLFTKKPSKSNVDTIVDFSGADTIKLDNAAFKGLGAGRLSASEFEAIDSLSERVDSSERILYDRDTGALYFDRNGGGRDLRVKFADLDNEAALSHLDFQVI